MLPNEKHDIQVLHADRPRSKRLSRGLGITFIVLTLLVILVSFIINEYNLAVNGAIGARDGVFAVFTTAGLIAGALMMHGFIALLAPGLLRLPWTVVIGIITAWMGRGYIEAASNMPGGTLGIGAGVRIIFVAALLFGFVVLAVWRLFFISEKRIRREA